MKTYNVTRKIEGQRRADIVTSNVTLAEARQELADVLNAEVNNICQNAWSSSEALTQLMQGGVIENEIIRWDADRIESDTMEWRIEEVDIDFQDDEDEGIYYRFSIKNGRATEAIEVEAENESEAEEKMMDYVRKYNLDKPFQPMGKTDEGDYIYLISSVIID